MEVEEEFLENAATMARFAEEEIKQFLAWTGKRGPYSRAAEELRAKLQEAVAEIRQLKKEYANTLAKPEPYRLPRPAAISRNNTTASME